MNGWDILRSIRNVGINQETPAVVVSVVPQKTASFGCRIQNFLIKPLRPEDLLAALKQSGILPNEPKSILFVDDDPKMLGLVQQYLKNSSNKLYCESDPEIGLEVAEKKRPDIIILDLLMPKIDGLEFLRRLRKTERGKNTPIIICTSKDLTDADKARIKISLDTIIQKGGGAMEQLVAELKRIHPTSSLQV